MSSLSNNATLEQYVNSCKGLWHTFQTGSIRRTREGMIRAVNQALKTSGVPEVGFFEDATSAENGTFEFTQWRIKFGGALASTSLTSDLFISTVDTVYHEARHCEQWYRIAQALSKGDLRVSMYLPQVKGNAQGISNFMQIPLTIATQATNNSNYQPVELRNIQLWFTSIYAGQSGIRGARLAHDRFDPYDPNYGQNYQNYRKLYEELDAWHLGGLAGESIKQGLKLIFPNLRDWKLLTGREWHFRSGKFITSADSLINVDHAIAAYETKPDQNNKDALKKAFDAWSKANPKERIKRDKEKYITKLENWLSWGSIPIGGYKVM